MITSEDMARYSRQILMPEIGLDGQQRLKNAKVFIVGVGGLGSAAAIYLASSGVGVLGLADMDRVERNNLHRQVLFSDRDIGKEKTDAARNNLRALNPNVKINIHENVIENANAIKDYDIVVDCTDNFQARYVINDACIATRKPNVYGSVVQFTGQLTVFSPNGPCYRCLFPTQPEGVKTCSEVGILSPLAGMIGTMQAIETIKLIIGKGQSLSGRLFTFDALTNEMRYLKLPKRKGCVC